MPSRCHGVVAAWLDLTSNVQVEASLKHITNIDLNKQDLSDKPKPNSVQRSVVELSVPFQVFGAFLKDRKNLGEERRGVARGSRRPVTTHHGESGEPGEPDAFES